MYELRLNCSRFTGLEPAVFAALVPNSAEKPLQELIEEIMGDHEMLVSMPFCVPYTSILCLNKLSYP